MNDKFSRTSDISRSEADNIDGGLFVNPFRRAVLSVPDFAASRSLFDVGDAESRRQDDFLEDMGPILGDLETKVMATLKDEAKKEKFRREFDDALAARRADDDAAAAAAAAANAARRAAFFPIAVFRRRPTFFIH